MERPAKRAIFIAIDGASMNLVNNMMEWGHMPNLAKLVARGVHRPMVGVFPTLTPPGWTALYTGAWHSTHEVMDFNIRALGRPLNETRWGINTELSKAEFLWNTLERAGKTPILMKVEMSWPPTVSRGIQVEGTGPGVSNYHQIAGYHLFVSGNWKPRPIGGPLDPVSVDPSHTTDTNWADKVTLEPVKEPAWSALPASSRRCLEVELTLNPLKRGMFHMLRGESSTPNTYFGLVYASGNSGYDRVRVCRTRNGNDALCEISQGAWSDWWLDSFEIDGKNLKGHVRMKLITLTPEADTFELFAPQIWPLDGYTHPPEIASELAREVGPFLQNPMRDAIGVIDDDTYFELMEYHHQNMADMTHYLASKYKGDVIFAETHAPDYANHAFLPLADETGNPTPEQSKRCREGLIRTFASTDRWIGRLLELADEDTVVVVASDHGGTPSVHRPVNVKQILEKAGLLVHKTSQEVHPLSFHKVEKGLLIYKEPAREVDISKSRVLPVGIFSIFVNLKGRDPGGIVDPGDYEKTREEIIAALMEYKDPQTGIHPFTLALTRENAEALNLWGELVGDVVYAVRPEFDGAHGRHLPVGRLGIGGQHSVFIMAGAGIRKGVALERQVRVIDVAPTLCYLLGLPMPRNVEGGVVYEALENPDWHLAALD